MNGTALALPALMAIWSTASVAQVQVDGNAEIALRDDGLSRAALLVVPRWSDNIDDQVETTLSFRIESAVSDTGLGSTSSFSSISKPLLGGDDVRVSIEETYLTLVADSIDIILGKQEIAWGSIDGVRVTDTVNPKRLTEFLAREPRPDRIPIWATRVKARFGRFDLDLVAAPDPTVNQLPQHGDAFFPTAPRLLGGLSATGSLPPIVSDDRSRFIADGTLAARLSLRLTGLDLRISAVTSADHDGVPQFDGQVVELLHPRRHSYGFETVMQSGPLVLRFGAAWTPDATFVVADTFATEITQADRIVAGVAADLEGPFDSFMNVQMIVDHVWSELPIVRPDTDLFTSVRIQKDFADDHFGLQLEAIVSLTDGDALLRAKLKHRLSENIAAFAGPDIFIGPADGLFGQYEDQSRLRVGIEFAF